MSTATVFQYGNRIDSLEIITLPAYVKSECPMLEGGGVVTYTQCHQLKAGEEYGVGSNERYWIKEGYVTSD